MLSITYIVAFTIIAVGLGWSLVLRLDRSANLTGFERTIIAFAVGTIILHLGVFFIGRIWLDSTSMCVLALACAAAAIPGLRVIPWRTALVSVSVQIECARGDWFRCILWIVILGVSLTSLIAGLAPPSDYDSLMYHLAIPKTDIEIGYIRMNWTHSGFGFFPQLMENLYRFGLTTGGEPVVQMMHGLFGLVAAGGAAALARRFEFGTVAALLAAVMYLAIRSVVWEMATSAVDIAISAFVVLAVLVYTVLRKSSNSGLLALFGVMIGGAISTKYHGFPIVVGFIPVLLYDLAIRRTSLTGVSIAASTSLLIILPILIHNFTLVGNPIFPLFNSVFNPGERELLHGMAASYGTGRGIWNLLRAPWDIFVFPSYYFDGFYFGSPYLLVFLPFAVFCRRRLASTAPAAIVAVIYFCEWFWLLSQQTRFLLPIMPIVATFAAVGATVVWEATSVNRALRFAFAAFVAVLVINQSMFIGIYAILRLPAAFGLVTAKSYLSNTPGLDGVFYKTCTYISQNLQAGERYFSYLSPHSYYCPQNSAIRVVFDDERRYLLRSSEYPQMGLEELINRLRASSLRFVAVKTSHEKRRNITARAIITNTDIRQFRFGEFFGPAIAQLKPLDVDRFSAVYDGPAVIAELEKLHLARDRMGR